MFERNYFFFHRCLLSCRCLMFRKQYFNLNKPKREGTTAVRRAWLPVATALYWNKALMTTPLLCCSQS